MLTPNEIITAAKQFNLVSDLKYLCNAPREDLRYFTQVMFTTDSNIDGYYLKECGFEDADVITDNIVAANAEHYTFEQKLPPDIVDIQRVEIMFGLGVDFTTIDSDTINRISVLLDSTVPMESTAEETDIYTPWRHRDLDRKVMIAHPEVYNKVVAASGINLAEIERVGNGQTGILSITDVQYMCAHDLTTAEEIRCHMDDMVKALSLWASCASVFIDEQK